MGLFDGAVDSLADVTVSEAALSILQFSRHVAAVILRAGKHRPTVSGASFKMSCEKLAGALQGIEAVAPFEHGQGRCE